MNIALPASVPSRLRQTSARLFAMLLSTAVTSFSQNSTYTWKGPDSTAAPADWNTSNCWTRLVGPGHGGGAPTQVTDTALVGASCSVFPVIDTAVSIGDLTLSGGSISGPGSLTLNGTASVWSAGFFGVAALIVAPAAQLSLELNPHVTWSFASTTLTNHGTLVWHGGSLAAGKLVNAAGGTFNDAASGNQTVASRGFPFTNDGLYLKTGPGTTTVAAVFNNSGTLSVQSGTLQLSGGGTMGASGNIITAAGALVQIAGATTAYALDDGASIGGLGRTELTGGILTASGTIHARNFQLIGGALAGTQTFSGEIAWGGFGNEPGAEYGAGSSLDTPGTTTIASDGVLRIDIDANASVSLGIRVIDNRGAIVWDGGNINGSVGGSLNNGAGATFTDRNANNQSIAGGAIFQNSGTYRKNGTGTTTIDTTFDCTGTVDVESGTLELGGGGTLGAIGTVTTAEGATTQFTYDYALADGATLSGAGYVQLTNGTLTANGTIYAHNLQLTGGTLAGTQTFVGDVAWSGGLLASHGNTTIAAGSTLAVGFAPDLTVQITGRAIMNQGTIVWNGGNLALSDANVTNASGAVFTDANTAHQVIDTGSNPFANSGTYLKTGAGTTTIDGAFANSGTLDVRSGQLDFVQPLSSTGVLRGSGTIGGSAISILAGGTIAPGDGVGTLTFADGLVLNDGAVLDFQLGSSSDFIAVTGGVVVGSAHARSIRLNLNAVTGFGVGTYNLISGTSFSSFDVTGFQIGSAPAGYTYTLEFAGATLRLVVATPAIPRPAAFSSN